VKTTCSRCYSRKLQSWRVCKKGCSKIRPMSSNQMTNLAHIQPYVNYNLYAFNLIEWYFLSSWLAVMDILSTRESKRSKGYPGSARKAQQLLSSADEEYLFSFSVQAIISHFTLQGNTFSFSTPATCFFVSSTKRSSKCRTTT